MLKTLQNYLWPNRNLKSINNNYRKFVLFGAGTAAQTHAQALQNYGCEIAGIFNPSGRGFFANQSVTKQLDKLVEIEFDFAVIASPNNQHWKQLSFLQKINKPALVEKPLVATRQELGWVTQKLSKLQQPWMASHNLRYQKNTIFLRELLKNIGEPVISVDATWKRSIDRQPTAWNNDPRISRGGILLDWGSHVFDLISYILKIDSFETQSAQFVYENHRVEQSASVKQIAEGGAKINVELSWIAPPSSESSLAIHFKTERSTYIWKKNGEVLLEQDANSKLLFKDHTNSMYDLFFSLITLADQNRTKAQDELNISINTLRNIFSIYLFEKMNKSV